MRTDLSHSNRAHVVEPKRQDQVTRRKTANCMMARCCTLLFFVLSIFLFFCFAFLVLLLSFFSFLLFPFSLFFSFFLSVSSLSLPLCAALPSNFRVVVVVVVVVHCCLGGFFATKSAVTNNSELACVRCSSLPPFLERWPLASQKIPTQPSHSKDAVSPAGCRREWRGPAFRCRGMGRGSR